MSEHIDAATLTKGQIQRAIIAHCIRMGSYGYFIEDELARASTDPAGVVVFRDHADGPLYAYYQRPEHRA